MSADRTKLMVKGINQLKNIGPSSNATVKFIYEQSPLDKMDDEDVLPPMENFIIKGRLLPNSSLYSEGSIGVQMVLGSKYPFMPPKVELTMPMFHPNVAKDGEVCTNILVPDNHKWTAVESLATVIEEVTLVIDQPSINNIQNTEAARLWDTDRSEYERRASELFRKHCLPR